MSEKPQVKLGAGTSKVAAVAVAMIEANINYMFPVDKDEQALMQELTALVPDVKVRAQVASLIIQATNMSLASTAKDFNTVVTAVYPRLTEVLANPETLKLESEAMFNMYRDTLPKEGELVDPEVE